MSLTLLLVVSTQLKSLALSKSLPDRFAGFRQYVPYLMLALMAAVYLYPFMRILTGTPDEGVFLYGAQMVLGGAIPSRDFMEPQGPGSFYWLAAFFKLFGTSLFTARVLLLVEGVATILLVFYLARRIERIGFFSGLFVLATSIPVMVMNSPHYDSNLFGLFSFAVFLYALDRISTNPGHQNGSASLLLFLAGLLAGITTCFIQQKGFWLIASFVVALFIRYRRESFRLCGILLAGYVSIVLAELSWFAAAKALPDLIYANFLWPLGSYGAVNAAPYGYTVFEILWPQWLAALRAHYSIALAYSGTFLLSVPYLFVMAVPLLLLFMGWRWRRVAFTSQLFPYWLTGYALWISELQRVDMGHLRNGCIILVILFFALCERQGSASLKRAAFGIIVCLELSAIPNALSAMACRAPLHSPHGMLYAERHNDALAFLLSHTRRGENIFVYPYQPIYYFLADVQNPTRFSYLLYHFNTTAQLREAVRDLEDKKVRYVLWDSVFSGDGMKTIFPAYRQPPREQLIVEPYLESRYHQIGFMSGFRILERK